MSDVFTWPTRPHQGKPITEVPSGFLTWAVEKAERIYPETKRAAREELARRAAEGETPVTERTAAVEAAARAFDGEVVERRQREEPRKALSIHGWPGARRDVKPEPAATCESCGQPGRADDPLVHRSCSQVPF